MLKTEFLTIYGTYENLKTTKEVLPSIIEETKRNDAMLIVHDSSENGRAEKWEYLQSLNENNDFFLILSTNMSMAHARNMCLQLGQELYAPDYVCMLEDDHGMNLGFIPNMVQAMKEYYGKVAPNGLRYGMFAACNKHIPSGKHHTLSNGHTCPAVDNHAGIYLGGVNSCCRCAPTQHWTNVLKGYDTDEYLISNFQTKKLNERNYNKGFTYMLVGGGKYQFYIHDVGRGATNVKANGGLQLWDKSYTASDPRSKFKGK